MGGFSTQFTWALLPGGQVLPVEFLELPWVVKSLHSD